MNEECPTEDGHDDVVLEYLDGSMRDEVEGIEQVAAVHDRVTRGRVRRLELQRQTAQAPGACAYNSHRPRTLENDEYQLTLRDTRDELHTASQEGS